MDAAADSSQALPLGHVLAAERERQGLSRVDVAQRLHMSTWQVEALETGDYGRLPKGMFLRGFVRNYTKVLGLNSDAALDALSSVAPSSPAPGIVVPSQNIRFDPLGERFSSPHLKAWTFAGMTLALVLAGMYWWSSMRTSPPPGQAARKESTATPAPQNLAAAPVPAAEPVAPPREAPRMEEPREEPKSEPTKSSAGKSTASRTEVAKGAPKGELPQVVASATSTKASVAPIAASAATRAVKPPDVLPPTIAAPNPARAPGTRTVTMRFKGSSWVEIRDRSGKVLLSKVNDPGSEAEVSGRPPFSVVVGNAPDVTMLYDDREFPLEPHTRVAVARFTLE
jgi:cytoskeleton protein RodZ